MELLAKYRRHNAVSAAVAAIAVTAADEELYPSSVGGVLDMDWVDQRAIGSARLQGRFCFVTHSESVASLRDLFDVQYPGIIDPFDFTAGMLKAARRRDVTQRVSRLVYEYVDGDLRYDGIYFLSQHGDDLAMWTIFERSAESQSPSISDEVSIPLVPDHPSLVDAMRYHSIRWAEETG